jgi:hypothetical protein
MNDIQKRGFRASFFKLKSIVFHLFENLKRKTYTNKGKKY